ncbi:hypothetical protein ACJX0J_040454, partial [Zea mays]
RDRQFQHVTKILMEKIAQEINPRGKQNYKSSISFINLIFQIARYKLLRAREMLRAHFIINHHLNTANMTVAGRKIG